MINQFKNKYKKFCIKMINYYKFNKKEFIEILKISKSNFLIEVLGYKEKKLMPSEKEMNDFCLFLENLTFLNLYIIKCPFIIETLSYEEIEEIISNKIDYEIIKKRYDKSRIALVYLINDIKNNKNILIEQSDKIKILHEFLLNYILKIYESSLFVFKLCLIIKYLMKIDFCMKFFFSLIYREEIYDVNHHIYDSFKLSLLLERKFTEFTTAINLINSKKIIPQRQEWMNINHNINLVILGDKNLKTKIMDNETYIKFNSIIYLSLKDNIKEMLYHHIKDDSYRRLDFIFILNLDSIQNYYSQMHIISIEFGISIAFIIYLEKNNKYIL